MKNNYFYFKMCVMMFAFFLMQATVANIQLRAIASAETPSRTYEFYKGSTDLAANLVQKQTILSGERLLVPELLQDDSGTFIGWFEEGAAEAFSFAEAITFSDSKTVKLQAKFSDKVYVHFIVKSIKEANTWQVASTKEITKGAAVNDDNIPIIFPEGERLTHWTLLLTADGKGEKYEFANQVNENISLYAVYKPAWRVYFKMRGGDAILPSFYGDGETLNAGGKIVAERVGYKFKGWTTEDPEEASGDDLTPNFTDSDQITENLELYALWDKGTAAYKVAYWQQNADDDGYSFVEIEEKSGTTESEAGYDHKDYPGFVLADKTNDLKPKIDGFGTTVKHVFYDRETHTLSFYKKGEKSKKIKIIESVKYGAKIDNHWNEMLKDYPDHLFSTIVENSTTLNYTHPPRMPNEDFDVKVSSTTGDNYIVYFKDLEKDSMLLPDFTFKYEKTTESDSETELTLFPDGTSVVEGFTQKKYPEDDDIHKFVLNAVTNTFEATRYFTRNSNYTITFFKKNGDSEAAVVGNISFEDSLGGKALPEFKKGETKRESDNFIFGGWFTAEETQDGAKEFVFEGKTMPAHNIVLYAKWLKPTYTVYFHLNNDKASLPYDSLKYVHNTVITEAEAKTKVAELTEGFFKWFWYRNQDYFVRYDFGMPITEDVHLYPTWTTSGFTVTYHVEDGQGTAPVDNNKYFVGKDAIVKTASDLQAPEGKFFIGWKPSLAAPSQSSLAVRNKINLNNKLYAPGEKIAVVYNLILTAQWGELPKMTKITYNANGGVGVDITEDLMNNQTHVTKAKETFTKDKQEIKSWNTKSDGSGKTFALGVSVIVNNKPTTPNELYAVWGNTTGVNTVASNLRINYHPNPVLTTLTIQCERNIVKVEILDALGKSVRFIDAVNTQQLKVDFSDLNTGLYYVRVFSNDEKTVFKVIKK